MATSSGILKLLKNGFRYVWSKLSGLDLGEYFDNEGGQLELTLVTANQLLIHQGRKQLKMSIQSFANNLDSDQRTLQYLSQTLLTRESLSLIDTGACLKGVSRGDSLMVIWKINNQSRRFRVKFSAAGDVSAETRCRQCVDNLAKHFAIKLPGQQTSDQSQISSTLRSTPADKHTLTGDVTLGQIAEALVKPSAAGLPSVYNELSSDPSLDLNTAIKLILTDPTFPAFVGQVEGEMKRIMSGFP